MTADTDLHLRVCNDLLDNPATSPHDGLAPVRVLVNRRTANMSGTGCWNTAIVQCLQDAALGAVDIASCQMYLALLDDDDEWDDNHLALCLEEVERGRASKSQVEWVVSGFVRISGRGETANTSPNSEALAPSDAHAPSRRTRAPDCQAPQRLTVADFLRGNPGVQGSNIFMRLPLLLRAGMFDESLPSMTDRDICIRALDVLDQDPVAAKQIAFTRTFTVRHYTAHSGRVTNNLQAKRDAVRKFLWKHGPRFSTEDLTAFEARARDLFGIDVPALLEEGAAHVETDNRALLATLAGDSVSLQLQTRQYLLRYARELGLCNTSSSEENQEQRLRHCLVGVATSQLERLDPLLRDLAALDTLSVTMAVFINTGEDGGDLRPQLEQRLQDFGLPFHLLHAGDTAARLMVSQYHAFLRESNIDSGAMREAFLPPHDIGVARTILQGHMKHIIDQQPEDHFSCALILDDDKRLPHSFLARRTLRELEAEPAIIYVGRDCKTAPNSVAFSLRTQLVDLKRAIDFQMAPADANSNVFEGLRPTHRPEDLYYDLATSRTDHLEEPQPVGDIGNIEERIFRGDPLARDCCPPLQSHDTAQRGGVMLLFRPNFYVLDMPQLVPVIKAGGSKGRAQLSRRSDSLWLAALQSRWGLKCKVHPALFVYHDNVHDVVPSATAIRSKALAETLGSILCRPAGQKRVQYMEGRVTGILCWLQRIQGLMTCLSRHTHDPHLQRALCTLGEVVDPLAWEREVLSPLKYNFSRLRCWSLDSALKAPLIPRGSATLLSAFSRLRHVLDDDLWCYVGQGAEGVVFRRGDRAYKVFFNATDEDTQCALSLLIELKELNCCMSNESGSVLSYDYVSGCAYSDVGGHGRKLVELLRSLRARGLVMTNIKPCNLVVANSGELKIVDLGRDWRRLTPELWLSMCRRAFLSWRLALWGGHAGGREQLRKLMQCERRDKFLPELSSFQAFWGLCEQGLDALVDPDIFVANELSATCATARPLPLPLSLQRRADAPAALLIKSCLMEVQTLVANVRHLVSTLSFAGNVFREVVLVVDRTKRAGLLRQHHAADEEAFDGALETLSRLGFVTRVLDFEGSEPGWAERICALNMRYLGVPGSLATHSENGEAHGATFAALETISAPFVMQVDSDIILNMGVGEDIVGRAKRLFDADPSAVSVLALPCYYGERVVSRIDSGAGYRFEIRISILHLARFRSLLPLEVTSESRSSVPGCILSRGWYRVFDDHAWRRGFCHRRYFDGGGFFVHPPNELKAASVEDYLLLADRLASRDVVRNADATQRRDTSPAMKAWQAQATQVDAQASRKLDFFAERCEAMIFVCCGRNLSYSRAMRCLSSLHAQRGADSENVGVVVVDDASDSYPAVFFEAARRLFPGRITCIHTGKRLGTMQTKVHCIKRVCYNPDSIIVTLDLDDFLLEQDEATGLSVVERINDVFERPRTQGRPQPLVALGGMVRHSKFVCYQTDLERPRHAPAAGNVWQHLRCFKKLLFDKIDEAHFRLSAAGPWIQHGTDWAFMIPIVEQAGADRVHTFAADDRFYFYEECTSHSHDKKHRHLAATQARLQSLPCYPRLIAEGGSHLEPISTFDLPSDFIPVGAKTTTFNWSGAAHTKCIVVHKGSLQGACNVPVRLHSECLSGDAFRSRRCDCGRQLEQFLTMLAHEPCGIFVYLRGHEGRGNGWDNKSREYQMCDETPTLNHIEALTSLDGCVADRRTYRSAVETLRDYFKVESVVLYTNNAAKRRAVEELFQDKVTYRTMPAEVLPSCERYLHEKVAGLDHDGALVRGELYGTPLLQDLLLSFHLEDLAGADAPPSLDTLRRIIIPFFENLPFHNLSTLLYRGDKDTGPLEVGASKLTPFGICYDRNVFLQQVLRALGFRETKLVGARTRVFLEKRNTEVQKQRGWPIPFDHVCLLVTVEGRQYLVDIGNGVPYFEPALLVDNAVAARNPVRAVMLDYRVVATGKPDEYVMEHCRFRKRQDFKHNYTFQTTAALSSEGVKMIEETHNRNPHFGHMLHTLRLNKWSQRDKSVVVKDEHAQIINADGSVCKEIVFPSATELIEFVASEFGLGAELVRAAPTLLDYMKMMGKGHSVLARLLAELISAESVAGEGAAPLESPID
jgi:GTP cyclohydrolase II